MKKTLIFICLLATQLQAQIHEIDTIAGVQAALSGPHPNLFEAQRIIEDWKAARPNALIGKTQKHWNRFYNFWKHRVTATGDPAPYFKNSKQHLKTQEETVGNILSLAVEPNSSGQILYAGTQSRGLFKSIDGGKNWINLTDNMGIPDVG